MHLIYAIDRLEGGGGGAQRQVIELALALAGFEDVRVSIVCYPSENFFEERLRGSSVRVVQIPKGGKLDLAFALRWRRWLIEENVDVVHAFMLGPILWTRLALLGRGRERKPAWIAAERNVLSGTPSWERNLRRWLYRGCSRVTANSQMALDEIHAQLGVSRERLVFLPNAIETDAWDQAARAEPELDLEPDRFQLAILGRLAPQKNHLMVLDALAELGPERISGWRVWFVGEDRTNPEQASRIRARVTELGLDDCVRIEPAVRNVAAFVGRLDGLLVPSSREGFPNVALEAMTLRVPVIGSRAGELARMIEPGRSGLLLERTTAQDLAAAMASLAQMSAEQRAALGRRAREIVEQRYGIAAVARQHLELYRATAQETVLPCEPTA